MQEADNNLEMSNTPGGADDPLLVARPQAFVRFLMVALPLGGIATAVGFLINGNPPVFWIVGTISLLMGLITPMILVHRVSVFGDRLEQRTLTGTRRLRFEEVERIRLGHGRSIGTQPTMGVKFYGAGTKIGLGMVKDSANVYEFISPLVVPLLAEKLNRKINEAGSVQFGKLTAQADGIVTRKGLLPWHLIGSFTFGPAGARILPTNHPELTVTVPNTSDNLSALMWITEWRKANFFENLKQRAAERGISEEEFLAAFERRLPAGDSFGMPQQDDQLGRHLCTLPPSRFLGLGPRTGKYALYEGGMVGGRRRIALGDCESIAYSVVNQYHNGAYIGTHRSLTLRSHSRVKIAFSSMREEAETFCDAVLNRLLPQLVSQHLQRIQNGETIAYGKVKISQTAVEIGRKTIPIAELKGVNGHQGNLYFWTDLNAKPVGSLALSSPNAMVLHRILHLAVYGTQ